MNRKVLYWTVNRKTLGVVIIGNQRRYEYARDKMFDFIKKNQRFFGTNFGVGLMEFEEAIRWERAGFMKLPYSAIKENDLLDLQNISCYV